MLESTTRPPPDDKDDSRTAIPLAVSPPRQARRFSSPAICGRDGPFLLLPSPVSPPPRLPSCPPALGMAVKLVGLLDDGQGHQSAKLCRRVSLTPDDRLPKSDLSIPPAASFGPPLRPPPVLLDLARLVQLQRLQAQRCARAQSSLRRLQVACARTARLVHSSRSIQRTFAECIRGEDKPSFTKLLDASRTTLDHCTQLLRYPLAGQKEVPAASRSFLDALSVESRDTALAFLTKIRTDGTYLADCVTSLTHRELLALLPSQDALRSGDSVVRSASWNGSRTSRDLTQSIEHQVKQVMSGSLSCPLDLLMHGVRGFADDHKAEDVRTLTTWSTVCARLIAEQKPGCERFVPAVLDTWASTRDWHGKDRFGLWASQILQDAASLALQPAKQSFQARSSIRAEAVVEDEGRLDGFYSQAVTSLLDVLGDQTGMSVIPVSVISMCHAIWHKLKDFPSYQRAFPQFVATRWLFSTFVPIALTLPEAQGLFADHHIPALVRQRVLREIASRVQRIVFDVVYSWRHGTSVSAENTARVQAVLDRFQPGSDAPADMISSNEDRRTPQSVQDSAFLALNAADMCSMITALHPRRRTNSLVSDQDGFSSGLRSSASSISGFSLFKSAVHGDNPSDIPATELDSFFPNPAGLDQSRDSALPSTSQDSYASFLEPILLREVRGSLEDLSSMPWTKEELWAVFDSSDGEVRSPAASLSQPTQWILDDQIIAPIDRPVWCVKKLLAAELDDGRLAIQVAIADGPTGNEDLMSTLTRAYNLCISFSEEHNDFVAAHAWSEELHIVNASVYSDSDIGGVLRRIESHMQGTLASDEAAISICEARIAAGVPYLEKLDHQVSQLGEDLMRLRDKMWFVADVRISGPYDEARSIVNALRVMGKPKRHARSRQGPPLRHWGSPKVSNTHDHLKSEAQILDLLSTSPNHGGPNKLSTDQASTTYLWMQRNNVENLCRGEERLHRLCMEIRKCVDHLLSIDSVALFQNPLFAGNDHMRRAKAAQGSTPSSPRTNGRLNHLSLPNHMPPSIDAISSQAYPLSTTSSYDYLESRSPTLTNRSSGHLWSEAQSPSSATSIGSLPTRAGGIAAVYGAGPVPKASKQHHDDELRQNLTSLLVSDLGGAMFNEGSETDRAFWTGLCGDLLGRYLVANSIQPNQDDSTLDTIKRAGRLSSQVHPFDFDASFRALLRMFSATYNLTIKLSILHDIDRLLPAWIKAQPSATSLLFNDSLCQTPTTLQASRPSADASVEGFRRLFSQDSLRPVGLLRDLQYIAALVPSACLETTPQGKAFWNAAVAISGIKQQARSVMVETADSIIAFQSNNRGHGQSSSSAQQQQRDSATFPSPGRTPPAEDVSQYTMADAAYLLQIAAKEGEPVAQRELATLYLTHPELMDHVIAPFASPKDVFKEESESKWRRNHDLNRCDPTTMCVAHHWMSMSSRGGDALAKEYLRQREEMEKLP